MTNLVEAISEDSMLTTEDNPHNPFTEYDKWWKFDFDKGYNTPGVLASVASVSEELSDADYDLAVEQAMQDLLDLDPLGIYIRVTPQNADQIIKSLQTAKSVS